MYEVVHEMCGELVGFTGNNPELTVSSWALSALLMVIQAFIVFRRIIVGKPKPLINRRNVPVTVPYVPGDTVLKLIKLLKSQENGWVLDEFIANCPRLVYGQMMFSIQKVYPSPSSGYEDRIYVYHNGVEVKPLSNSPDLDDCLLRTAFFGRLYKQRKYLYETTDKINKDVEKNAQRELDNLLTTI